MDILELAIPFSNTSDGDKLRRGTNCPQELTKIMNK